ncbi:helix-turn-helix domain-containing protein [Ensifer sp. SL37]|uniref:helix-turn-helix domain-containing protein n=1 Tax=Ensifer sp. SL37 TaxID=2995137 RepID=UPI0022735F88|nr:helix-turn-helix transcriptional regulator [Ensifer sp. SL37]MCY1740870.1 helix-turn-helix transcriptional regulator [Ensifer sp. SL37]
MKVLKMAARKKSANSIDAHIGRRIRNQRLWQGMTQGDLGDAIGVTFQQVQKYEKGSNRVGASRLDQIAKALSVEPWFFFDEIDAQKGPEPHSENEILDFLASIDGISLNRSFVLIKNSDIRQKVVDLVELLAEKEHPGLICANLRARRPESVCDS